MGRSPERTQRKKGRVCSAVSLPADQDWATSYWHPRAGGYADVGRRWAGRCVAPPPVSIADCSCTLGPQGPENRGGLGWKAACETGKAGAELIWLFVLVEQRRARGQKGTDGINGVT